MRRVAALLVVLALAGCGGASRHGASGPTPVSVTLDWVPNPDHVGLYYALDHGDFARAGLKVSLRAPSDASAPLKLVGVNRTDLAISYEPEVLIGAAKGLPVVAVAAVIPVPLNSLIAKAGSGIASARSLAGRSVGITGLPSDDAILAAIQQGAHLAPGSIRTVHVGYSLVPSLLAGKVDAILGGYRNVEAIQIAQRTGRRPTVIPVDRLGVPSYDELVLVANAKRLRSDPGYAATVRRFVGALVTGSRAARADRAGSIRAIAKVTGDRARFLDASVPETLQLLKAPGAPIGCLSVPAWRSYASWMRRSGLLASQVDAGSVATDRYRAGC